MTQSIRVCALSNLTAVAIFACASILCSCADDTLAFEVDSVFTDTQRSEMQRAADEWNAFTAKKVQFAPIGEGDWLILRATVPNDRLGYAQRKRRLIRIHPATADDQIYAVALHEIGHALGLNHVSKGVMDGERQSIVFSDEDMAECRRVGACSR